MKISFIGIMAVSLVGFISCQPDLYPGDTKTAGLQNDWFVNLYLDGKPLSSNLTLIHTYNVSSPVADSLWVDDGNVDAHLWQFKARVVADVNALTFNCKNAKSSTLNKDNSAYTIDVTITNGKIMPNAAKSPAAKAVTDSIYMKIEFSDDPGKIYEIRGFARTKFGLGVDPQ